MQIVAAEFRRIENGLRQDHAVGNDDRRIRLMRAKLGQRFRRLQGLGRKHGNAESPRFDLNGCRLQLHATPARLRRAAIDRGDLMTVRGELQQRWHGEIRRAHEDQTKGHEVEMSCDDQFIPS